MLDMTRLGSKSPLVDIFLTDRVDIIFPIFSIEGYNFVILDVEIKHAIGVNID